MLTFYAQNFGTVEVNNTFYQLPAFETFETWHDSVPQRFLFAVKGSRFITHMKKLKDPKGSTSNFFLRVEHLGKKLGPILFQLPPKWHLNISRLRDFLDVLPAEHKYVFEFRDQSWFVPEVYDLLSKYKVAFCIHDFADMKVPDEITTNFTYLRFHGPTSAKYSGSYSDQYLRRWAKWITKHQQTLRVTYAYFNNDPEGSAVRNALTLKHLTRS